MRIGASVSLSGAFAKLGVETKAGYDIWKDFVNKAGGIKVGNKKYSVEIVYYDDKSDAQTAAKLTEKLITEDKVKILFGPYSSGITDATATIAERYKAITLGSSAYGDVLYDKGRKYIFCPASRASTEYRNMLLMIKEMDPSLKRVAILAADNVAALGWANGGQKHAKDLGFDVVAFEKYPLPINDLSSAILSIKSKNPDILLSSGFVTDGILMLRQMKDLRFSPKVVGGASTLPSKEVLENLKGDAEGLIVAAQHIPDAPRKDPVFGSLAAYQKLVVGTGPVNDRHVAASAAGVMLQKALERAGTVDDVDKIREALLSLDLKDTIFGPIKLENPNGINGARFAGVLQVQGGKFVPVFPANLRKQKPVYPFKSWEKR
ncbi:MAG: amino acid ABC transporter substrate-binding protein [Betaproteobacteria bacterium]|nr:amino acid ABC transporter substrate-binding protein [Betaproteobacteria bacterium]